MKKKNVLSIFILASSFSLLTGVICSGGFNVRETSAAETASQETETVTLTINQKLLGWSTKSFTSYSNVAVGGTDLTYSTTSTVKSDGTYLLWNYYSNKYGGLYNTVALPGPITSIGYTYKTGSYVANAIYVGTKSNPTTNKQVFDSSTTSKTFEYDKSSNFNYFKVVQTGKGTSYIESIIVKYEVPKTDPLTDFSLDKSSLDLGLLDQHKLSPTILPETADQKVSYESSDATIASVSSAGTITGLKAGTATITATTVGKDAEGNAKTATCVVNVTGTTPTIKGLRDETGKFKEELSNVELTLSGVITSIDTTQKQMTIEDNGRAILLYKMSSVTSYKVGDKVNATGAITSFHGLLEISSPKIVKSGTSEVPAPTKLENTDAASLLGLDSIIFEATGKLKEAQTALSGDTPINFVLSNGKEISVFSKGTVSSAIGTKMLTYLKKAGTTETLTFKLPLGWFDKPQLSLLPDMSVVSSTNIDAVDKFVADFMHPEVKTTDAGTGKCISEGWYSKAKEAYLALTEEQKNMFDTNAGYKDMKARYDAWARVNPEVTGLNIMTGVNNSNTPIIIAGSLVAFALASFGLLFLLKKKKANK